MGLVSTHYTKWRLLIGVILPKISLLGNAICRGQMDVALLPPVGYIACVPQPSLYLPGILPVSSSNLSHTSLPSIAM